VTTPASIPPTMSGMTTQTRSPLVKLTVAALLVAALGIVVQILFGADYPTVPPGLFVLVVPAALVWFVPWRWMPVIGAVASLFQVVGLFASGQADRLFSDSIGDTAGLWLQLLALAVGAVAGFAAVRGPSRVPLDA
jgi:hypothetical protein